MYGGKTNAQRQNVAWDTTVSHAGIGVPQVVLVGRTVGIRGRQEQEGKPFNHLPQRPRGAWEVALVFMLYAM